MPRLNINKKAQAATKDFKETEDAKKIQWESDSIIAFSKVEHYDGTVEMLQRVRLSKAIYPPPESGISNTQLSEWLFSEQGLARLVAVENNSVIGHVQLTEPHHYLTDYLKKFGYKSIAPSGFAEISKLFADPLIARQGIGTHLLNKARACSWSIGRQPALAVVSTSLSARRIYAKEGLIEVGTFDGIHGINHVLIDPIKP